MQKMRLIFMVRVNGGGCRKADADTPCKSRARFGYRPAADFTILARCCPGLAPAAPMTCSGEARMTVRVKTLVPHGTSAVLLAAAALLATPAGADQGFYLGAIGGVTLDPDLSIRFTDSAQQRQTERARFEIGAAGSIVAGYTFAGGLRPELELGYRRANFDGADGNTAASQAIGSLYYNFSRNGYFFYLGGGGGYANVRLDVGGGLDKDDDGSAVYSLGSGFGVPVGRQLMIGVDYRYVGAVDRSHYQYLVEGAPLDASFRYRSHVVGLSLRYSFGSALADSHPAVRRPSEPVQVVPLAN